MTKKEAIYILRNAAWLGSDADRQKVEEAVEVVARAIEALNHSEIPNTSEPKCADGCIYGWGSPECGHCDYRSEEPKTGDTISRKAAIDVAIKADIENHGGVLSEKRARIIDKRISAMPSAQPEPKTGHWIPYDQRFPWSNEYKCSECGNYLNFSGVNGGRGDANFCPSCGADMRQSNAD